jgi:RNA-splicing ligase RtcB
MFGTNFGDADPKSVLDAMHKITHFGQGGRKGNDVAILPPHLEEMLNSGNIFLSDRRTQLQAREHMMTQGDGNHFAFVGTSEVTGQTWLITHHGSRGFGASVYKAGMQIAEKFRAEICPTIDPVNAWIPADTPQGITYWQALEIVREWTKVNHSMLHDAVSKELGAEKLYQRWNPHNFVFCDPADPSLYWHAKGATPVNPAFSQDTDGVQIIPLNMGEPILFVGNTGSNDHGFAPHGAGRNMSRTNHKRAMAGETDQQIFNRETKGIDARFWCGKTDISELPSAYKSATLVQEQMKIFDLARVVDRILPYGSIMAGDIDAPWRKGKKI